MTYATQQDMIDRFSEDELIRLTDRGDPPTGAIDATVVTRALEDADNLIDGYLASRYALPLESVPAILKQIACDMARYRLYDDQATEQVTKRHADAIKTLDHIAAGNVVLQIAGVESETDADEVQYDAPDRRFTLDGMETL